MTGTPHVSPPPDAASLRHLRPTDAAGLLRVAGCGALTVLGVAWSLDARTWVWLAGQILTAGALVQWFVLLHECGHATLFQSRRLHHVVGPIAGALAMIPFATWRRVHGRHHKWTGWQDLDPTAVSLLPRRRSRFELRMVDFAWRWWLPLFAVAYRTTNYWNLPRLRVMFPEPRDRRASTVSIVGLALTYAVVLSLFGISTCLRVAALAVILSFVAEDLLLLSQHAHVPQQVSRGTAVRAFPAPEQAVFTRSLRLPAWASAWLLHFDAHELHHMYPFVPGYRLRAIRYQPAHEIGWWEWVTRAKALPGTVLLFQNRDDSGWDL